MSFVFKIFFSQFYEIDLEVVMTIDKIALHITVNILHTIC